MKVGKYQIGRFHAIIRKEYADGSVDYETSFTDIEDFNESYYCILKCIGKEVGIATDNPKVLTYACVIRVPCPVSALSRHYPAPCGLLFQL